MKKSLLTPVIIFAAAVGVFTACGSNKSEPNVELIQDMLESPALKAQEYDESAPNHRSMRVPPEGTQPVGFTPYRYAKDLAGAAKNQNPMAGDFSEENLKIGLKFFQTNCAVCHGAQGQGGDKNNTIAEKMAVKPPPLISPKVRGWSDGTIYHVITMGQGVMGPYASHIPQQYRWQVVNYIRYLQKEAK